MKKCETCKIEKDKICFCKESRRKDGLCNQCKQCLSNRKAKYKKENLEHSRKIARESAKRNSEKRKIKWKEKYLLNREDYLSKNRERYKKNREKIRFHQNEKNKTPESREKSKLRQRKWRKNQKIKSNEIMKKWIEKNRFKKRAHYAICDAIRRGKMLRGTKCERCDSIDGMMEAHHYDYTKPLEVIWLCYLCHKKEHGKLLDIEQ